MRILVTGSGAREHAIVRALAADPQVSDLCVAPGNPGMAGLARRYEEVAGRHFQVGSPQDTATLAAEIGADLVVIGPEVPLVAGAADRVRAAGIACFGPSEAAARIEGSKTFAKEIMDAAGVPTARSVTCRTMAETVAALDLFGGPYVVKDDGLAAGKGVVVTESRDAALYHAARCLDDSGAGQIVIEEYLSGPEISLFCLSDGRNVVPLAPAQDFKRLGDGDAGPNTGGMGAYSPLPWAPADLTAEVVSRIARPVIEELARRDTPFVGLLYCGLILTPHGLKVIEFNARFGDPETQVVLARLRTPLAGLLQDAATGALGNDEDRTEWSPDAAVTVVLAAAGYPGEVRTGDPIDGIADAEDVPGVHVLHAGTAPDPNRPGGVVTAGGRVLSVVALGQDLAAARERVYQALSRIVLTGGQFRSDIAGSAATATRFAGWRHASSGKVRELYLPDGSRPELRDLLLVVASDRISAYDHVLPTTIPDKGAILTELTRWWLDELADLVPDHRARLSPVEAGIPPEDAARSMVCHRLDMFPVECVVRGYLTGSGLADYRSTGAVCGHELPAGLVDGDRLPEPIFTPATKATTGHDENIDVDTLVTIVGQDDADRLRELSLALYRRAESIAARRGIILADTKFEFGRDPLTGQIVLGDEVLTPDSSRFWDAGTWQPGQVQASFDKQFVRDWLTSADSGWDRASDEEPPALPADVVAATRARYVEAYERLTGLAFG